MLEWYNWQKKKKLRTGCKVIVDTHNMFQENAGCDCLNAVYNPNNVLVFQCIYVHIYIYIAQTRDYVLPS
jgi:hypothetical protein